MKFIVNSSKSGPLRKKETYPKFDFATEESDNTSRIYAKEPLIKAWEKQANISKRR